MCDKDIIDQIISEEPSYEEKELKKYRDFSCMFCLLDKDTPIMPKKQIVDAKCVAVYL
jgi:hypothetical protein